MFSFGGVVGLVVQTVEANIFDDLLFQRDLFAPTAGKEFTSPYIPTQTDYFRVILLMQYLFINIY